MFCQANYKLGGIEELHRGRWSKERAGGLSKDKEEKRSSEIKAREKWETVGAGEEKKSEVHPGES